MRITVFGASGQIGSQVCALLRAEGHEVVEASRNTGVDVLTGEGVAEALQGAHAPVDVLNSPSFDDEPVLQFFDLARIVVARGGGQRTVVIDPDATYFGAHVDDDSLVTGDGAVLGSARLKP